MAPKKKTEYNKTILMLILILTKEKCEKKTEIFSACGHLNKLAK